MSEGPGDEVDSDAEAAVLRVLHAKDYYAVLEAQYDSEVADLRKRYLATSIKVHPDKNKHPDATKAFQRVAEAWNILSDEITRKRYNDELDSTSSSNTSASMGSSQEPSPMSPEDAFATFAFATAACAAGGSIGGRFAETFFFAEQLVERRRTGEALSSRDVVSGGFVLSSGLEALGATAHAAGLKGVGTAADRTAKVVRCASQVAAVGAVASQIPAVQEAIASGTEKATERARQLATKIEDAKTAAAPMAKETATQVKTMLTGVSSWVKRAREKISSAEPPPQPLEETSAKVNAGYGDSRGVSTLSDDALLSGVQVRIFGLVSMPSLNGATGTFLGLDPESGRCRVQLDSDGQVKRVKLENIEAVNSS